MITFDAALAIVQGVAFPLGTERILLEDAAGRVLSAPVVAGLDAPRQDVSTMDGYAVRDADLSRLPCSLQVVGEAFPGTSYDAPLAEGTCVRIFTGAALPPLADRVVIQEMVQRNGNDAVMAEPASPATYIRRKASDFAIGDVLLRAGRLLDARALIAAGAADLAQVEVYRQPRLAIVATGDELRKPGSTEGSAGSIPESITLGLQRLPPAAGQGLSIAACCPTTWPRCAPPYRNA